MADGAAEANEAAERRLREAADRAAQLEAKYKSELIAQRREAQASAAALSAEREERTELEKRLAAISSVDNVHSRLVVPSVVDSRLFSDDEDAASAVLSATTQFLSPEHARQPHTERFRRDEASWRSKIGGVATQMDHAKPRTHSSEMAREEHGPSDRQSQQSVQAKAVGSPSESRARHYRNDIETSAALSPSRTAPASPSASLSALLLGGESQLESTVRAERETLQAESTAFAEAVELEVEQERRRLQAMMEDQVAALAQVRAHAEVMQEHAEVQALAAARELRERAQRTETALSIARHNPPSTPPSSASTITAWLTPMATTIASAPPTASTCLTS